MNENVFTNLFCIRQDVEATTPTVADRVPEPGLNARARPQHDLTILDMISPALPVTVLWVSVCSSSEQPPPKSDYLEAVT